MDQLMIDVSNVEGVVVGDEVVLFGDKELSADQFAEWSDTISYEVVCAVSRRVPRVYLS
jgi:alanine racemase